MMNTKLIILSFFLLATTMSLFAATQKFELKTRSAQLLIDQKKNLRISDSNGTIQMSTTLDKLWNVTVKNIESGTESTLKTDSKAVITQNGGVIQIRVTGGQDIPFTAGLTLSVKDDSFCFGGSLRIEEGWSINELVYPAFEQIQFKSGKAGVYWTNGLGQYFDNTDDFGNRSLPYPSAWATMPWFSINTSDAGLYIGCHDPLQSTKHFDLEYDKSEKKFNTRIRIPIYDREYTVPDLMIKPYSGTWHSAATFYRSWYDKHFDIIDPPDWVKDDAGWLLAILKQQNMEIMWPYKEIDKLCDVAERLNLKTIGLFGWAHGGHDHLYPFYTPDNTMGGRHELEKAIERAHKRGIRIIIYANGKIMDTSTDFYSYYGFETMLMQRNRQPEIQYYIKQKTATPVIFAQACTGSDIWRRTMYNLALQAASLGADGILYDQLGVMHAIPCFSEHHDHKPGHTDPACRLQMANEARKKAREINPNFIVMTEAANDFVSKGIDYTHGWGASYYGPDKNAFPSLFRYTFPEFIATQRNGNPMITRTDANFAAIYGLRHEIETRYPGDVEYLLNGTLPTKESYSNMVNPPNIRKMNLEPAAKATQYVHSLIDFEMKNSDFFRRGNFIDEEGFEVSGTDMLAKGFVNGNQLGVVIWNQHLTETRNFTLSVPGYELKESKEPGNKNAGALTPLQPNSIRLIIYEKI